MKNNFKYITLWLLTTGLVKNYEYYGNTFVPS